MALLNFYGHDTRRRDIPISNPHILEHVFFFQIWNLFLWTRNIFFIKGNLYNEDITFFRKLSFCARGTRLQTQNIVCEPQKFLLKMENFFSNTHIYKKKSMKKEQFFNQKFGYWQEENNWLFDSKAHRLYIKPNKKQSKSSTQDLTHWNFLMPGPNHLLYTN